MKKKYILFFLLLFNAITSIIYGQTPGGVSGNLKLWLKADAGVNTNGSNVTSWLDQSGGSFTATQGVVAKQPAYMASNPFFNGNPSVNFDLIDDGMPTAASINSGAYSFFVVYNSTSNDAGGRRGVQGAANWLIGPYQNVASFYAGSFVDPRNIPISTKPTLNTATSNGNATLNVAFSLDGKTIASGVTAATSPGTINLGSAGGTPAGFGGSIAEVISYNKLVNAAERNKVESYLALKYGITLDQTVAADYVNSTGTVLYPSATTNSGFAKDVAGIVRDNGSGLNQIQSKSANPGSVVTIISPTALNNDDYFIAGDNGAVINSYSTDVPAGYGSRLQRVWRASKSTNPGTVTIRMFIGDMPEMMSNPDLTNVALLINSTNSFTAATTVTGTIIGTSKDTIEFTGVTLNDGDYFTLAMGSNTTVIADDFEFWFGVPYWQSGLNTPQKIHFTGISPTAYATYIIDMPADASFVPITGTIAPSSAKIIDMTPFISNIVSLPSNTIINKGLRIRIEGRMGAYYAVEAGFNYGTFPLRGPNALGTSFYIPGQTLRPNAGSQNLTEFVVTATSDGTVITITPSEAIVGHGANVPFDVVLNKGQSYVAQAISLAGKQLGGSLVTSTLPVVITYSEDYIANAAGTSLDNMGDQLVPISKLGKEYVHIRANLSTVVDESIFITGVENGTTVTIFDGTTTQTLVLNAGEITRYNLAAGKNVADVKSDKPVSVYQMGGFAGEYGGGLLTGLENCKGTNFISFQYPTLATTAYFNFVAPDAAVGSFLLNNKSTIIQASDFLPIPGVTGWKYARKDVTSFFIKGEVVNIQNTLGKFYFYQNVITPGGGDFSNFSDFGNVVLFPIAEHVCTDNTNTITLKSGAIPFNVSIASYIWTGPNGFTSLAANPVISNITSANMGTYLLTVIDEFGCSYNEKVEVNLPVSSLVTTPISPTVACIGSTVPFTSAAIPSQAVPKSILWTGPNGFTSSQANFEITGITADQAGDYVCTYTDMYGCNVSATTTITLLPAVLSSFTIGGKRKISCDFPSTTLSVTGFTQGINYETFNPYDAPSLFASSNFNTIVKGFYNQQFTNSGITTQMDLGGITGISGASTSYGVKYRGFINITTAGNYTFYVNSKDGSNLSIDGSVLVSNDGSHTATEVASVVTNLSLGYHAIQVNYFNGASGGGILGVSYAGPGIVKQAIPATALFYAGGTDPGLTYTWRNNIDATIVNGPTLTTTVPGIYTVTGTNGICSSDVSYTVTGIDSYDYSDLGNPGSLAQARVLGCVVAGIPVGTTGDVWAGYGVSTELSPLRNAKATADIYDDGLLGPISSGGPFVVKLNSNIAGKTVYYGLWFDWNNNGDFADDGVSAFYNGSGVAGSDASVTVVPPGGANPLHAIRLIVSDAPIVFTSFDDVFTNAEIEDYTAVLSVSGTVFDDANGLLGSPINTVGGIATNAGGLFAVLVNSTGKVVANAVVAADGTYFFNSVLVDTYSIVLSTTAATIGAVAPIANTPAGWANSGENIGISSGNDGIVDGILTGIVVNIANVINANFGIDSRPIANPLNSCAINPGGTIKITVPTLTGSDLEDGPYTGSSNTNKITILTLPAAGILYYNNVPVTAGQIISNYNPGLLALDLSDGIVTTNFTFSEIDAAGINSDPVMINIVTMIADAGLDFTKTCTQNASGKPIGTTAIAGTTYLWTPATGLSDATVSNPTADPAISTSYTLTATDTASGCSASDTVEVTVNTTLPAADAGLDFTKTCTQNASGKPIGTTAIAGTTYLWTPATGLSDATVSNPTADPIASTSYTLTATDTASGCSASDTVEVTVNTTLPAADAGLDFTKTCTQNASGKPIGTTAIAGTTYLWTPATGLSDATVSNPTADPAISTSYTLTATDTASGCSASDTVEVTVNTTLPTADAGLDFTKTCTQNASGKPIGTTAIAGTTYLWTPATGLSDATVSNPTADPAISTSYTLTATDTASGCSASDTVEVTVNTTLPAADAGLDFTKTCTQNASGKPIGTTAIAGTTYLWTPATGLSDATVSNPTADPIASTSYTLTATDTASGCSASDTVEVTVNTTLPAADAGLDFTKTCTQNASGKPIGTTAIAGTTYLWTPATGLSDATVSNPTADPAISTSYTLTATDTASGCSASDTVEVTVNTTLPAADAGLDFTKTCTQNASGKPIGTTAIAGTTYLWTPATGLSDATVSNPTADPAISTSYTLTATDTASGCSASDTVEVTVNTTLPAADAGLDFTKTCTQNASGKPIGTTAIAGTTYLWTPATGLSDATVSNPTADPIASTSYTLTATDTASGCSASDTVEVTVNTTLPTADAGLDFTKTCTQNASGKPIGTTAIAGTTYLWTPATGLSDATVSNPTADPIASTSYTLTATDTASGCSASDTVEVTVNTTLPAADAGLDFTKTCTQNASGKPIGTTAIAGTTYLWTPATGLSDATVSNPTADPAISTSYTLTATDTASGCSASDTVEVTVNTTLPAADAGLDFTKTCTQNASGKPIGTTAIAGTTYLWTPATGLSDATVSNPTADPAISTSYTLTATDTASGCSASDTVEVTVNTTLPAADAGLDFTKTCTQNASGKPIGTTAIAGTTYLWTPATGLSDATVSNPTADPIASTSYTLTATDTASGCSASDTVEVTVNTTLPTADAGLDFTKTCTQNASGKPIGTTAIAGTTYLWTPATGLSDATVSNPTADPAISTSYTLTATDTASGCSASDTVEVTVNTTLPAADAGLDFTKTCTQNASGKPIGTTAIAGTTYLWTPATGLSDATVSNPTADPIASTSYTLTATDTASGCSASDTVEVTVNTTLPAADAGLDFTKTCTQNASGKPIGTTAIAGTTYLWTPATGLSDATVSNPTADPAISTSYTLTATDTASGCSASDTVEVTVNTTLPAADAGLDFTKTCTQNASGKPIGTTAIAGTTYLWTPATGLSDATVSNPTADPAISTSYTLTATDTASGCSASDTVEVTVNSTLPAADAGLDFTKTCTQNASGKPIGTTAIAGTTYLWTPATGLSDATVSNPTADPIASTSYTLTATDTASGCSASDTVEVTVNTTLPTADAGLDFTKTCTQNASGKPIGTTAIAGTTYLWTPATGLSDATVSNPTADPIASTSYTLTATDTASGCSASDTVEVTVNTTLPAADAGLDFTKTCTQNASGKPIGTTAIAGTTYLWTPATGLSDATVSNPTADPAISTSYTLTATDTASGCSASDTVEVTVNTTLPAADAGLDFTKTCTQNASGKPIGTTAIAGTTYLWTPATGLSDATVSNPTADPAISTSYTLTATDTASGCSASDTVEVTVNTTLPAADAGLDFTKTCTQNASGKPIGTAAIAGTTYLWTPATGLSDATVSNPTADPIASTSYTLTATDTASGCSASDTVEVTVNTTLPAADAGLDFTKTCTQNASGKPIGTTAIAGTTYLWTPATGLSDATVSNPTADPAISTSYTLTATDTASGCSASDTVEVTVNTTLPAADAGLDFTKTCTQNASGKPIGTTAIAGTTYLWTPATGLSDATVSNPTADPAISTSYTLTATDTASGCSASDTVEVTVNTTLPAADAGLDFTKTCTQNASGKPIGTTAIAGTTYLWTPATGLSDATVSNPTADPAISTSYTLTATDTASGCSASDTVEVTVNTTLPAADAGLDFTKTCTQNASGKPIGTTAIAGTTYLWTPATGLSDATVSNPTADPIASTSYTLTATDTASGCSASDTVEVTVNTTLPTADAGLDFTKTCTQNASGKPIGTTAIAGTTYLWTPATGLSDATVSNPTADPAISTSYTLTATDTASGCSASDTVEVTVNTTLPAADAGLDFTKTCTQNASGKPIGTTAIAGTTYLWTPATGLSDATVSNPTADPAISTSYTLTATDTASGCSASDTVEVTVNTTLPAADAGLDFTKTCTQNASGKPIGTTAIAGTTYLWTPATGLSDATVSNPTADPIASTSYTLTATDTASGCSASDTVEVTVNTTLPTADAGLDFTKTCTQNASGKPIGTTAIAGTTYLWTPATGLSDATVSNPTADPIASTSYTLTATDTASGCSASDTVEVTVNTTLPTADAGLDFTKTCTQNASGKPIGTTAIAGTTYLWTPATGLSDATVSNPTADPIASTSYTLTATDTASGCSASDTVEVTVNTTLPAADAGLDFTKTCTQNASGKPIGTTAIAGTTYLWTPATGLSDATVSNPTADPAISTSYTLTATDTASGCSASDTVEVTVNTTLPAADAGLDFTKTCTQNASGKPIGTTAIAGTTYLWTPATGLSDATVSNPTADPAISTSYTLTATDTASGCSASDTVEVTVNTTLPAADAGLDFTKTCTQNASGKPIGTTAIAGTTYLWTPATGLSDATVSNPTADPAISTSYTLTATDTASGCSASDTVEVTVNTTLPAADAGLDFTKTCTQNASGKPIGTTAIAGTTYLWTPATGLSDATVSNPTADPAISTSYTLTATDTASGCSASDTVEVTVNTTLPAADAGLDFTKTCTQNASGKPIGTAAIAGTTYLWTPATGLSDATVSNPTADPIASTSYTLTATDTASGCSASDTVEVTVNTTLPTADAGLDFTKTCTQNASGKPIGTTAIAGTTYLWTPATGLSDATVSNPTADPIASTSYTLTATDTASGCSASDTVEVTVNTTLPAADAGLDFTKTCTQNASGKPIGTTAIAGTTYLWTPATGLSDATVSNPTADPAISTSYTLTATDTASGCSASDTVEVTVNTTLPAADAGLDFTKTCTQNASGKPIGTTAIAGTTYLWTPATGLSDATVSNPTADPIASTSYTLTATDTASGCSASDTVEVTVNTTLPAADAGLDFTKTCTQNASGKPIGTTAIAGTTYLWTPATGLSDATVSNPTADPAISTSYTLTATDTASGCSASDTVEVTVNTTTPQGGSDKNIKINSSVIMDATGIGTWTAKTDNPGVVIITIPTQATTTISGFDKIGTYSFIWTGDNGCTDAVDIVVSLEEIDAITDDFSAIPINGKDGGTTPSVLTNDTLNGEIILTAINAPTGLVLNTDGTISVLPNTPSGNYVITYSVCEKLNPDNCDTTTATILVKMPNISLVKSSVFNDLNGNGFTEVGETITYSFTVSNTGSFVLSNIIITDPLVEVTGGPIILAPGAIDKNTFSAVYILTEADVVTGKVINQAMVSGNLTTGNVISADSDSDDLLLQGTNDPTVTSLPGLSSPSIALVKTATLNDKNGNGYAEEGETVSYHFVITNKGNLPLNNITISDPLLGIVMTGGPITLKAGEENSTEFIGLYTITQSDINNGSITNQATVYGMSPNGTVVSDLSDYGDIGNDAPTVLMLSKDCLIEVFNALSANEDGIDDLFMVKGLECYPNNNVQIFNRWGVSVFNRDHYNNKDVSFKGISDGRVTIARLQELPIGTYFYIVKYEDNASVIHELSGYLYINK